ncbi:MAG: DUF4198 domain-containing protein [Vicinamibacterales bacterium]
MTADLRRRVAALVLTAAGVAFSAARPLAHDFWIQPSTFTPRPGAAVELRLLVGDGFIGDVLPRNSALIEMFLAAGPEGVVPVPGQNGLDPAGVIRIRQPGVVVVGYHSRRSTTELAPAAFAQYLTAEGLEHIAARSGPRAAPASSIREVFSRCAKSLLLAGPPGPGDGDRVLGFPLELVSEKNPYRLHPEEDLPVRVLLAGAPLAGALVVALSGDGTAAKVQARSDREGRVALRLPRPGVWLIKAVHLLPAPAETGADWESLWASLTFDLPPAPARRVNSSR